MKNNKENRIKELLAGYMAATLSPAEEKELRELYASGEVSSEWEAYAPIILMGKKEGIFPAADEILNTPDESEVFESICKANAAKRWRKGLFAICGAAASVAAVVTLVFTLMPRTDNISPLNGENRSFSQADTSHSFFHEEKMVKPALVEVEEEKTGIEAPAEEKKVVKMKKVRAVKKYVATTYKEKADVEEKNEEKANLSAECTYDVTVGMGDVNKIASDGADNVMKRLERNRSMEKKNENVEYVII